MKTIVELNNISYKYDKRKTAGINKLNLKINKSECLCLIGPSGSGKTTTAKIIAKLLSPQDGTLLFKTRYYNFLCATDNSTSRGEDRL